MVEAAGLEPTVSSTRNWRDTTFATPRICKLKVENGKLKVYLVAVGYGAYIGICAIIRRAQILYHIMVCLSSVYIIKVVKEIIRKYVPGEVSDMGAG